MSTTKNMVVKGISFSPRNLEMAKEIRDKLGCGTTSEVFRIALVDLYLKVIGTKQKQNETTQTHTVSE